MAAPYEIHAGPFTAWLATAGTTEPLDLDAAPPVAWTKLGAGGSDNYDEDGVTWDPGESLEYFRGLGKTGRLKAWRTEEEPAFSLKVYDVTPEMVARVMNNQAVTTTAAGMSISGAKSVGLLQGHDVASQALLLRSDSGSAYGDAYKTQLWVPNVVIDQVGEIAWAKGSPAGLDIEFAALQDSTNGFGKYRVQSAVKTG